MKCKNKLSVIVTLVVLLIPNLLSMLSVFPKKVEAVTTTETLLDTDKLKIETEYEFVDDNLTWLIHYEKKDTQDETLRRLKLQVDQVSEVRSESWGQDGEWLAEQEYAPASQGTLRIKLSKAVRRTQLMLQLDELVGSTETLIENVLGDEASGPYQLVAESVKDAGGQPSFEMSSDGEADVSTGPSIDGTQEDPWNSVSSNSPKGVVAGKKLVISNTAMADQVAVTTKSLHSGNMAKEEYAPQIVHKTNGGTINSGDDPELIDYNYARFALDSRYTYTNFIPNSGSTVIAYTGGGSNNPYAKKLHDGKGRWFYLTYNDKNGFPQSEEIVLEYNKIGLFQRSGNEDTYAPAGVKITLKNIIVGPSPDFIGREGNYGNVWMEFSTNLFSGVLYNHINSFDATFEFYETDTKGNFVNSIYFEDSKDAILTFASLTSEGDAYVRYDGKGNDSNYRYLRKCFEFAGVNTSPTTQGSLTSDSLLSHGGGIGIGYGENTYYSANKTNFTDYLGGATFHRAAVTFPLSGTEHSFKFGSTYGRAWNSFASSKLEPIMQKAPTKTVQPVKQYQENDAWNNPTGPESGFKQRYWNDMDSFNNGDLSLPWDLPETYRQAGHDPTTGGKGLAAGIPVKNERYVEKGKSYYYFINQETLDVFEETLIVPTGYVIEDTLPTGVNLDSTLNNAITVYNLDGQVISGAVNLNQSSYNTSTRQLKLVLTQSATELINVTSGKNGNQEKDFSIRIKTKVADNAITELMENQAKVTFGYTGNFTINNTKNTNKVHTRLFMDTDISFNFKKVNEGDEALAGAKFTLYNYDSSQPGNKGTVVEEAISSATGQVTFTKAKKSKKYVVSETTPPSGYQKSADFIVTIDVNGNVSGLPDTGKIINKLKPIHLSFLKKGADSKPLSGAVFLLKNGQAETEITESTTTGLYELKNIKPGTYTLSEKIAPAGYKNIGEIGTLTVTTHGDATFKETGASTTTPITVDKSGSAIEIKLMDILNKLKPFNFEIKKVDKADPTKTLSGAEFELYDKNPSMGSGATVLAKAVTNDSGIGKFEKNQVPFELRVGVQYFFKETKRPSGYKELDTVFAIILMADGTAWIQADSQQVDQSEIVINHSAGEENNFIQLTVENELAPESPLPKTGGIGRTIWVALGVSLVAVAGIYLHQRNKKGVA